MQDYDDGSRVLHLENLLLFTSMLLPGMLESFHTLALLTLAHMSHFPIFRYSKNACKKERKGLEVGNDPKGSET